MTHDHAHDHTPEQTRDDVSRMHERDFWEERYAGDAHVWSGRPNQPVVDEATDLTPGRALDVAAGEGGDALWLAEQGWDVTALDVSQNALDRARAGAESRGLDGRVQWLRADVRTWRTDERFDLVTSAYMHLPSAQRREWLAVVADLVVPGGTLIVVNHDESDLAVVERPHAPDLFATAQLVATELDPALWEVVTAEARVREAVGHDGEPVVLHDAVLRARRR